MTDILSISEPEQLFTRINIKSEYKDLVKLWHPDVNKSPNAEDVFLHISALYNQALAKIDAGEWYTPGELFLTDLSDSTYRIRYKKLHKFELGEMFIGEKKVTFSINKTNSDLFNNGIDTVKHFKWANNEMRSKISGCVPVIEKTFETSNKKILIIQKDPESVLLRDLLAYFDCKLDPKHVAWIISRCYNVACYLQYLKKVHCGFSLDTVYVIPKTHEGSLLGGWWYTTKSGSKLTAVPKFTFNHTPSDLTRSKIADYRIDLETIKALGRQLLGDMLGNTLHPDTPAALKHWLLLPSSGSAIVDYENWHKALEKSFGARRFVKLDVMASDIYNGEL